MNKKFTAGSAAVARRMLAMAAANAALLPLPSDDITDWALDLVRLYVILLFFILSLFLSLAAFALMACLVWV